LGVDVGVGGQDVTLQVAELAISLFALPTG
jgi:hypothetical protein